MSRWSCSAVLCLLLMACRPQAPAPPPPAPPKTVPATNGEDSGAVSSDAKPSKPLLRNVLKGSDWPSLQLAAGEARIHCDAGEGSAVQTEVERRDASDDVRARSRDDVSAGDPPAPASADVGSSATEAPASADTAQASADPAAVDGVALTDLGFVDVSAALAPCRSTGLVRVQYAGKINGDFTALVERIAAMADRMRIQRRVLDIDSTGGRVEDAMPAGDAIAESHWSIRVRPDAVCHSACVLVLAAGDERRIEGRIGIHRMIRVGSKADSRAQLSQELREVYAEIKDYLERNGASVAVADLMMTVPNRSLRLLTETELNEYGLSGDNAVQDDLDRIRLTRRCGEDFVKRKDAYRREFEARCAVDGASTADTEACAQPLRTRFGFPDDTCPADGPLAIAR